MRTARKLLAIPLILAASSALALGSEVRDKAGLFSPAAVKKANADLGRIERETNIPVEIETIPSLNGQNIDQAIKTIGSREGFKGLIVLIASRDGKIGAGASHEFDAYFNRPRFESIYEAFLPDLNRKDFDAALAAGVSKIESTLLAVKAEHGGVITPAAKKPAAGVPARRPVANAPAPAQARTGVGMLIGIVLLVLAIVIGFRLIGALFGAGRGGGYGGPGYGPGGPMRGPGGYGAPGYGGGGGGGGGFMSSLFGGIGGAMAGNWLYDQFSGRHRGYDQPGVAPPSQEGIAPPDAGNDWGTTAGDGGGDWGGTGDAGGGGGGDWGGTGGGGGDWGGGGGGGDWGGGGGGDWGGGGGDGGSW
jgi:hypothetical protein